MGCALYPVWGNTYKTTAAWLNYNRCWLLADKIRILM